METIRKSKLKLFESLMYMNECADESRRYKNLYDYKNLSINFHR